MTLPGETKGFLGAICSCGKVLELEILITPAGYYLGYLCSNCGPWSRETGYYRNRASALKDLKLIQAGSLALCSRIALERKTQRIMKLERGQRCMN